MATGDDDSDGSPVPKRIERVNRVGLARPSLQHDIANSMLDVRRQSEQLSLSELKKFALGQALASAEENILCKLSPRATAYKNVFGVSLSFGAIFGTYLGIQALQSSINEEANLGVTSLVVLNAFWILSAFITPTVLRLLGTKHSLISGYVVFLIYIISNSYPRWYTLIPTSILLGLALGPVWASLNIHITNVAVTYAPKLGEKDSYLIVLFAGILAFHLQLAQVVGNLVSAVVLLGSGTNSTLAATNVTMDTNLTSLTTCDAPSEVCNNTSALTFDRLYLYILVTIYAVMDIIGIVIAVVMVDNVRTETKFLSASQIMRVYVREPLVDIFKTIVHWKSILMYPLTILNAGEISFIAGRFARVVISECVGVQWVGFAIASYGSGSAVSAITVGRLVKYIPEPYIVYLGLANNSALVLFLLFWERVPSFVAIFLYAVAWGLSDGTWNTLVPGLIGVLFPDRLEAGFSVNRIAMAIGFLLGFVTARTEICTAHQLWGYFALIILSGCSYTILAVLTKSKADWFPCCVKKMEENVNDDKKSDITDYETKKQEDSEL